MIIQIKLLNQPNVQKFGKGVGRNDVATAVKRNFIEKIGVSIDCQNLFSAIVIFILHKQTRNYAN